MKWGEGRIGRVFVGRLEDGDKMPEAIEKFAESKSLLRGICFFVGGIKSGRLIVGPSDGESGAANPIERELTDVSEMEGTGTIFPDEKGSPRLHMHASFGRGDDSLTGCIRKGVKVWNLGEVIMVEIDNSAASRKYDPECGFNMMEP